MFYWYFDCNTSYCLTVAHSSSCPASVVPGTARQCSGEGAGDGPEVSPPADISQRETQDFRGQDRTEVPCKSLTGCLAQCSC